MPTLEYLLEQAARCRRLAAHVRDKELQRQFLDLAEEYERKAAEPPAKGPDSRLGVTSGQTDPGRAQDTEELENETTES